MRRIFFSGAALFLFAACAFAQQTGSGSSSGQNTKDSRSRTAPDRSPDHRIEQPSTPAGRPVLPNAPVPTPKRDVPTRLQQPKRILGIMPNYRAVSAGAIPPPPRPAQAFTIATENSFDYSSFVFVAVTSLDAEAENSHPALGKGIPGFWGYYWRGWVDKTDGNYWVIWALPTVLHEDERYFAKGEGSILDRGVYAASRVLITPNYHEHNTFNGAEIFGRGISQAISLTYYPSSDRTAGELAQKYGYALGRDALTNVFREFWPDIDARVLHRHRHKADEVNPSS